MASVLIASVSLVLSMYVFWMSRLQPARLALAAEPGSYRTKFEEKRLLLRIPIVVVNRGARNGVLTGLRFEVPSAWMSESRYCFAHRTYAYMDRDDVETRRFFEPIAVGGGSTAFAICEFIIIEVKAADVAAADYPIVLEYPRPTREGISWSRLGEFKLRVTDVERAGFDQPMTHFNGFRTD
jgi:hypothetical protein